MPTNNQISPSQLATLKRKLGGLRGASYRRFTARLDRWYAVEYRNWQGSGRFGAGFSQTAYRALKELTRTSEDCPLPFIN